MKHSLIALIVTAGVSFADVRISGVFSDHVVLQRNQPVPIWGWSRPGETVTVEFAGQTKTVTTAGNGKWLVSLDALQGSSQPRTLTVRGENTIAVHDVVVGEVWLCSGQSNMALLLAAIDKAKSEMAEANDPL